MQTATSREKISEECLITNFMMSCVRNMDAKMLFRTFMIKFQELLENKWTCYLYLLLRRNTTLGDEHSYKNRATVQSSIWTAFIVLKQWTMFNEQCFKKSLCGSENIAFWWQFSFLMCGRRDQRWTYAAWYAKQRAHMWRWPDNFNQCPNVAKEISFSFGRRQF